MPHITVKTTYTSTLNFHCSIFTIQFMQLIFLLYVLHHQNCIIEILPLDSNHLDACLDWNRAFLLCLEILLTGLLKPFSPTCLPITQYSNVVWWLSPAFFCLIIMEEESVLVTGQSKPWAQNVLVNDILLGTVQGLVFGPVLYAIYISPLFDLEDLSAFGDDN